MKYLLLGFILMLGSCASSGKNMIIQKVSAQEWHIVQGLCTGSTIHVDEENDIVVGYMYCQDFNMSEGELIGEIYDFESLELPEGQEMVTMTLDTFKKIIEHYEVKKSSQDLNRIELDFSKRGDYARVWKENFYL